MEKRTFWPFSVKNFPQDMNIPIQKFEADHNIAKMIYEHRSYGNQKNILYFILRSLMKDAKC